MTPTVNDDLLSDFDYSEPSSKTFKLHVGNQLINGTVDGLEALKQAIYLILNTERYECLIYSWNYGIELRDLIGKNSHYVLAELKRRIEEALLQDSRITEISEFSMSKSGQEVRLTFKVATIYGDIETEKAVTI